MKRETLSRVVPGWIVLAGFATTSCAAQEGWKTHQDPTGFQVSLPEGWSSEGAKDGHALIHNRDRTVFAVVQPFKLADGAASETIAPLVKHMSALFPNPQVSDTHQISNDPDEALAHVSYTVNDAPGQASVLCVMANGAGMFYAIGAPAGMYADKKGALIKVLQSFKYGGSSAKAPVPKSELAFETWTDPNEGAFETQVPRGWTVYGGAFRFAPIDIRRQMALVSPDGRIHVSYGAAKLTALVAPGPSSAVRGLHEGQSYEVNGVTYTVLHYLSGTEFSEQYVDQKLKKQYPDISVTGSKERPDLEEKLNAKISGGAMRFHATVGETDFTFTEKGQPREGACVTATVEIGQEGPGMMWQAFPSYLTAPSDEMPVAWKAWGCLVDNIVDDPAWSQKQSQVTAQFNQLVMRNHEIAMQQIHDAYVKASQRLESNFRGWDNVINGTVDVRDSSGATFNVEAGHNFYWRQGNTVVGTNTVGPPDINFTPLKQF